MSKETGKTRQPARESEQEVSAQCPACRLHALVPVHLVRGEDDRWRQRDGGDGDEETLLLDACPVCFGAWFDRGELDLLGDAKVDPERIADGRGDTARRRCPRGHGAMVEHHLEGLVRTPIDRCHTCEGVWLDGGERRKLAASSTREGQQSRSERLARRGVIWALQLVTQLPVEVENPARGTPWTVYALLAAQLAAFLLSVVGVFLYRHWAVIAGPMLVDPVHTAHTLITHQFFHASWVHLLGNAYFLYVFGDNVEHLFGRPRFVLLFFGAGLAGGGLHALMSAATATPVIGASGAIAGVMAAYLWSFPQARLFQVIPFTPIQLKIPAWAYLGVWVAFQAAMGFFSSAVHYAWFSHLGGFLFGLALTPLVLAGRRRRVARSVRVPAAPYAAAEPGG